MREGWEVKELGTVVKTGAGGTPLKSKREYYENGNIPWLLSGEVAQGEIYSSKSFITEKGLSNSSAKLFPINSVLIAMYGATAGQVGILRFESSTNQAVCGIFPNENFIPEFLFYFFLSQKESLLLQAVGNAQPNISQAKIKKVLVPIPPLPEQNQIVNTLDKAFKQIDQAKANLEKNLNNAKELFQSKLNEVFSQRGEGWEEKRLGEIASVEYGFTAKSTTEGTMRYVRITDIDKKGNLILDGKKYIEDTEEAQKFQLKENDILMARTGATFGKVLLYKDYEPSVFASYLIRIHFTENISNELYWYFSKSQYYWSQANSLSSGSAQPHFNGKALKEVIFSYPKSGEEQEKLILEFKSLLDEIEKLQTHYQQKLNNLEELKKSILQKAFRGEL